MMDFQTGDGRPFPPKPLITFEMEIPHEWMERLREALIARIPAEMLEFLDAALSMARFPLFVQTGQELPPGGVKAILRGMLADLIPEMVGKTLVAYFDETKLGQGLQFTLDDHTDSRGAWIAFAPISEFAALPALNTVQPTGTLGSPRMDGDGENVPDEVPDPAIDLDVPASGVRAGLETGDRGLGQVAVSGDDSRGASI